MSYFRVCDAFQPDPPCGRADANADGLLGTLPGAPVVFPDGSENKYMQLPV